MHPIRTILSLFVIVASVSATLDSGSGSSLQNQHRRIIHNVVPRSFGSPAKDGRSRRKRAPPSKARACKARAEQSAVKSDTAEVTPAVTEPATTGVVEIEAKKKSKKTSTKKASQAKETPNSSGGGGGGQGNFSGDATFYNTGLTACGTTHKDSEFIAAVAASQFDSFPGAGANPNKNPICGRKIRAFFQGNSVDVTIRDRCVGCKFGDLDFTPTAFEKLASLDVGRITRGMTWQFI